MVENEPEALIYPHKLPTSIDADLQHNPDAIRLIHVFRLFLHCAQQNIILLLLRTYADTGITKVFTAWLIDCDLSGTITTKRGCTCFAHFAGPMVSCSAHSSAVDGSTV